MMHGHEKSDPAIVAMKPANKAEGPSAARPAGEKHVAEPVEPRAGTKGNADARNPAGHRAGPWCPRRSPACAKQRRFAANHPRWEPYAGKPHVRFCAGGAQQ